MVPSVNIYVRQRVNGKRTYVPAEDKKGKLQKLEGTYYLRHNMKNSRFRQWRRVGDMAAVPAAKLNLERELKKEVVGAEYGLPLPAAPSDGRSYQSAMDTHLADKIKEGESKYQNNARRYALVSFQRHSGVGSVMEVTREHLLDWRDWLLKQIAGGRKTTLSPVTVGGMLTSVTTLCNRNDNKGLLKAKDKPQYQEEEPEPYTPEVMAMINNPHCV